MDNTDFGPYGTYLVIFYNDMIDEGLTQRTIRKHFNNVEFFLNEFVDYYSEAKLENGCYDLEEYFGD